MTPSPVNWLIVPPYRRTTAVARWINSVMISRNRSAPTAAAMSIERTTSAKSTVTCLYSASLPSINSGEPHASQKRASARGSAPHVPQDAATVTADRHSRQHRGTAAASMRGKHARRKELAGGLLALDIGQRGGELGALGGRRLPRQLAVLDHLCRRTDGDGEVRDLALDYGMRSENAATSDRRVAKDRHLGCDPGVGSDPHRTLEDALVFDRQFDAVHPVVEVAQVDPVGHQHRVTQFDVEVGVDDVVPAEDDLVAEAQRPLVAADRVLVTDVHPATDLHRGQLGGRLDLHTFAEEHHAAGDDVRVGELELQQPPVAHEVPRGVSAVGDHPLQRGHGEELGLARVTQPRTPPPLMQRCAPHRRHGRKAYANLEASNGYPHVGLMNKTRRGAVFRRSIVLASTALITAVLAGCGNTDSWVDAQAASGWPAQYGDARNS